MKITAAIVPARSQPFEIHTLDLAGPQPGEVLVRILASGLCHTDLHARDGYFPNLPYPVVCGHEGAGIVEAVGAAVTDLAAGDPVVISYAVFCLKKKNGAGLEPERALLQVLLHQRDYVGL